MSFRGKGKNFIVVVATFLFFLFIFGLECPLRASDPYSAYYSTDNDKIFWFILLSDVHIGARGYPGSEYLEWMVTEAKDVINPSFIVNAGDLTDSTNWSELGYPDGPHTEEWQQYRDIVVSNGVNESFYYDIPGNHDHYGDQNFAYYLNYSIQGAATGQTQISWTRTFGFGTYHFLGVNTCGNDGADFSMLPPTYGDNAGLDASELAFIETELEANKNADLTLIFGHHLIVKRPTDWTDVTSEDVEAWTMTALIYGADEFIALMDAYNPLMYAYGHSHVYREEFFTKDMANGVLYLNVASLAKSDAKHYNIVAIDCNGISTAPQNVGTWPAVIITAPLDRNLGVEYNPYTYAVTDLTGDSTPIRALVFDKNPVTQVEYRTYKILEPCGRFVDRVVRRVTGLLEREGIWHPMTQVAPGHPYYPYLWEADCPNPRAGGDYTIEVRATGSSTQRDSIPTAFPAAPVEDAGATGCFVATAACDSLRQGVGRITGILP
jgi:hypothetical protein